MSKYRIGGMASTMDGFTRTWRCMDRLNVEDELVQVCHGAPMPVSRRDYIDVGGYPPQQTIGGHAHIQAGCVEFPIETVFLSMLGNIPCAVVHIFAVQYID